MALKTVFVELKAKVDKFNKQLKSADKQTGKLQSSLKKVAKLVAGAFAVRAVVNYTKSAIQAQVATAKLADSLQITNTQAQQLEFIAGRTGTSIEEWNMSALELEKRMSNIANDTNLQNVLKGIGLGPEDFAGLSKIEKVQKAIQAISKIDASEQVNALDRLFGGGGVKTFAPLVGDAERYQEVLDSAAKISGPDGELVDGARELGDLMALAKIQLEGMAAELGSKLIPLLSKVLEFANEHFDTIVKVGATVGGLIASFMVLSKVIMGIKVIMAGIALISGTIAAPIVGVAAILAGITAGIVSVIANWEDLKRSLGWVWDKLASGVGDFFGGGGSNTQLSPDFAAARAQAANVANNNVTYNISANGMTPNQLATQLQRREKYNGRVGGTR